jgi:iron complex outermembrane receptor protein
VAARPITTQAACLAAVGTPAACSADIFTTGLPNGGFQRGQDLKGQNLPNAPKNKVALNVNYTWLVGRGSITGSASYVWRSEQYGSIFNREYYKAPAYDQVDMRATWKDADGKYSVIAFVRNLFDEIGYAGGPSAGRRNGVVPAYVTGTIPAGGTATTPIPIVQGIASAYTITPPRTYGIEIQYRFF